MASPINNRSSSPDIPLALSAPSSSKTAPAPTAAPSAPTAASSHRPSPGPAQQRFLQPSERRLSAGLTIKIKPNIDSLNPFDVELKALRQQTLFRDYAQEAHFGLLEMPDAGRLPSIMEISVFEDTINALREKFKPNDGIDMQHAPSSAKFPCKLSFPILFKDALSGQGVATASFSMSGTLGLLTFTSTETGSISFDANTIAPYQPLAPADKRKGKQRANTSTGDASDDALAASRENSGSPAPYIEHDAKFAAALQEEEWELAAATRDASPKLGHTDGPVPAGSRAPSPAAGPSAGPSAGAVSSVPASYSEIKPLPYVDDVLNALPDDGKTAYGLYAVLNAATHSNENSPTTKDAVKAYLEIFNAKTPEEKHKTIKELRKRNSPIIGKSYAVQNQTAHAYLKEVNVSDLLIDFAKNAARIQKEQSPKTSKSHETLKALAQFTKLAYPPGPFVSDCINALGSSNKEVIDIAFYVDIALCTKADTSPRDLLEGKDLNKIIGLIQDLRAGTSITRMKKLLIQWRSIRHPLPIDQVLINGIAEKHPEKVPENANQFILILPIYKVLNNLTDVELIQQLRNESIFNNDLAILFGSTKEGIVNAYQRTVRAIAGSKAVKEHLTKLQATPEIPTSKAGDRATAAGISSRPTAPAAEVARPNKKQRLE